MCMSGVSDEYIELPIPPKHYQTLVNESSHEFPLSHQATRSFQMNIQRPHPTPYPQNQSAEECSDRQEQTHEVPQDRVLCKAGLTWLCYIELSRGLASTYIIIYCVHCNTQLLIFGFLLYTTLRQHVIGDNMTSISAFRNLYYHYHSTL